MNVHSALGRAGLSSLSPVLAVAAMASLAE
jgi:hypothetical protein